jgi:lipoate-protein ligase A
MLGTSALAVTFDGRPRPGDALMAEDAARFAALESGQAPPVASVRWFRWDRPTLSLGRGQDPATLDLDRCAEDGVPVVVRPTGGRAVFHADEWTYAALVPLAHPLLGGSLRASCRALVAWVAGSLEDAFGVVGDAEGAPSTGPATPGALDRAACFGKSFGYELSVGRRKLMGSAQRRGRVALLQQGSLLVGPGQERLARYLRGPAGEADAAERALAAATTHLTALCGDRRPDLDAFERAFRTRGEALAGRTVRMW